MNIKTEKINKSYLLIWLFVVLAVTLIISVVEFTLPLEMWLLEIARNFIISLSISVVILFFDILFDLNDLRKKVFAFFKVIFLFALAGIIGGGIAWIFNSTYLDFYISHPIYFFFKTSTLSILFGIITFGYLVIRDRLIVANNKINQKELNEQVLIRLNKDSELKALRAMVNPHFLFNTLNSISSLIYEDPNKAEESIQKLSSLFRKILNSSENEYHKIADEIDYVKDYLEIEKTRLGSRLNYEINIDTSIENVLIPTLLIQPLIENSIIHGISNLTEGGKLIVECTEKNNMAVFIISNDISKKRKKNSNRFGINGVLERIKLNYGENYKFDISELDAEFKVCLAIPLMKENKS